MIIHLDDRDTDVPVLERESWPPLQFAVADWRPMRALARSFRPQQEHCIHLYSTA